jgi:RNA polymerase sigma factor (sigma-70 family)
MSPLPLALSVLLSAPTDAEREHAWRRFLEEYTRLLLYVARSVHASHDDAMDAYTFVLEQLGADEYRLLRKYAEDGRSKFTTWLVVVARRLCLDHGRRHLGRRRDGERDEAQHARDVRRRLHALSSSGLDVLQDQKDPEPDADEWLRMTELRGALDAALSTLPDADRLLLKLRFDDEMSAAQIADLLGFPSPFHVYRRLKSLVAQLRTELLARGIESSAP